mmetsp:Transcript_2359/g.6965  ORF Transcript_2359/g.6965 Transcript_2359/m.6965 type:complete len:270 (-) Transcript_2359:85-894(-)
MESALARPSVRRRRTHWSSPALHATCSGASPERSASSALALASSSCCATTAAAGRPLATAAANAVDPSAARLLGARCCLPRSQDMSSGMAARAAWKSTVRPASSWRSAGTPSATSHSASASSPASHAHMAAERPPGAGCTSEAPQTSTRTMARSAWALRQATWSAEQPLNSPSSACAFASAPRPSSRRACGTSPSATAAMSSRCSCARTAGVSGTGCWPPPGLRRAGRSGPLSPPLKLPAGDCVVGRRLTAMKSSASFESVLLTCPVGG